FIVLVIINFIYTKVYSDLLFTYSELIIYAIIAFLFLFLERLFIKVTYDFFVENSSNLVPVMIYGTDPSGISIGKMILFKVGDDNTKYKLVGFIDNNHNTRQKILLGVRVYPYDKNTIATKIPKKAKNIIVSPAKLKEIGFKEDLDIFINNNLSVLTSAPTDLWENEIPDVKQIRSIKIEDLLGRQPIHISTTNIENQLKSKIILVTGAAGSIGSEIVHQLVQYQPLLIVLVDNAETPLYELKIELQEKYPQQNFSFFLGDVRDQERMEYIIDLHKPDIIYHAAAYKHVPMMEDFPTESIQVNVKGTKVMADLAVKYKVKKFVMISTDKAVNPTNVMGASKRIAEIYIQSLNKKIQENGHERTKFITTRFGNVLGSNGSVIPHFQKQIEKGGPVTVTHPDIIRYFMTISEASNLVLEASAIGEGGEIYIFDMGNPIKISDLARKMIKIAGYVPDVEIKIIYTGLRQGEKLYEELLNQKEKILPTQHPKIMVAKVIEYEYDEISLEIEKLLQYSSLNKDFLIVQQMKKIVPEFKSNNSQFEFLDILKKSQ
ncbi:MAG TPA: nucleoside-diphosphate sugar epimerase/dehydratase, partial [Paludibacteraceae bacterium]|nr:nucleoside-diphosphate sugar epimerase/dehydratase [Paludibacteraceae bacterium]